MKIRKKYNVSFMEVKNAIQTVCINEKDLDDYLKNNGLAIYRYIKDDNGAIIPIKYTAIMIDKKNKLIEYLRGKLGE